MQSIKIYLLGVALVASLAACKKSTPVDDGDTVVIPDPNVPVSGTRAQLTKDSIFLYAKEVYLWNDALPSYTAFNPRKYVQYGSELDNYRKELFDISQLKINPLTGKPYEYKEGDPDEPKFSYIDDADASGAIGSAPVVSQVDLEGKGDDLGFTLSLIGSQSMYQIYVRYVNPGSSASRFLRRGDVIQTINNRSFGTNYTSSDESFIVNALNSSSITVGVKRDDGSTFTRTINKTSYTSDPVYKDTVITAADGKKIGYLAFARFSNGSNAYAPLADAFSKFAAANVPYLVIDLRYNGGGYVQTAERLSNLIAPSRLSGSVMFTEYYNTTVQSGKATILKNQPLLTSAGKAQYQNGKLVTYYDYLQQGDFVYKFSKQNAGTLNSVTKVVFITSGSTASASELVINVLKPHLDVKLVGPRTSAGTPQNTYGKPVGFFPVKIGSYDVYFSMFETRNSLNEGNYHAGFVPNILAVDDVSHDFGDPREAQFAAAINYLVSGTLTAKAPTATIMGTKKTISSDMVKPIGSDDSFKGMIRRPR